VATSLSALNGANQAITDYVAKTGIADPNAREKNLLDEIDAENFQLTQVSLSGDKARKAALTAIIAQYNLELVQIAPIVDHYNGLVQSQSSANAVYNKALEDQNKVDAEIASNHDSAAVSYRFVGHVSRVPDMIKFGGIALAIGLVLTIGFIVFMEFYRPAVAQVPYLRRLAISPRSEDLAAVETDSDAAASNGHSTGGVAASEGSRSSSRR
jgi:hypothetical protein